MGTSVKVSVVEDDEIAARALGRMLQQIGHSCETFSDAAPVLERLSAGTADWDAVLLDIGLPGTSGVDVLRRFRDAGAHSAIVMVTADHSAATATECLRAGAFHYLTKPFGAPELSTAIESAARYASMRKQLAGDPGE